jgi:hypothetical protein
VRLLHPSYDPIERVWYVDQPRHVEARTLVELLGYFGAGYRVRDYYPGGVPWELLPRSRPEDRKESCAARRKPAGTFSEVGRYPGAPCPKTRSKPLRKLFSDQENRALDMWLEGHSAQTIAERIGRTGAWVGAWVVPKARKAGDPRALVRFPKLIGPRSAKKPERLSAG